MFRTFVRSMLAVAMIAGASCAALAQDDYSADCPGGHAHGIGLHGHGIGLHGHGAGLHGHGHRPYGDYPLAYNRAVYDENFHEYTGHGCRTCNGGNCQYRFYGQPDLFYNYYTWNNCGAIPAALYVSPRPVPPHVGHTYITYQPLYPHEFMYTHHRTYHRYYNGGQGLNRTSVHYRYSPFGEWH